MTSALPHPRGAWQALAVFVIVLLAYGLTAGGHLYSPDEEVMARTVQSLVHGQGLAIAPLGPDGFATSPANPPRADGREYAQYGIGQPLLATPLFWLGEQLAASAPEAVWQARYGENTAALPDFGVAPTAAEIAPRFALSWFNVLVGATMAAVLFLLCLELTRRRHAAWLATLLYALGSLAWPHSRPFFSESLAALCVIVAWWALVRGLRGRRLSVWCLLAGAVAGYAALVRADSVLLYPGLACLLLGPVAMAARVRSGAWGVARAWCAFCLPALLCGGVLLGMNYLRYGDPFSTGYEDQPEGLAFDTPVLAGLFGFLFSAGKGLFFFSPALVASFWGWGHLRQLEPRFSDPDLPAPRRRVPWLLLAVALSVLVPLLVHAKWQNWAGGWCWGPRHVFKLHVFLALPIAAWLAARWTAPVRVFAIVLLIAGAGVQLLGSSQDFITFHHLFFRAPGSRDAFFVQYDDYDRQFWEQHYQVLFRPAPSAPARPVPLFVPAPIQSSLYHPQHSVWAGYPRMWRAGMHDFFWLRMVQSRAAQAQEPPPATAPASAPRNG